MSRSFPSVLVAFFLVVSCATPAHAAMPVPKAPSIDARAYVLMDHYSGRVIAQANAEERMEPASLTKLMTAYAVFVALREGRLKLDDLVTISERAWRAEGSRTFVEVGTQVPVEALIKGMIVQSGNDATIALAEHIAGTEEAFAQLMNEYARQLGMTGTHFENSAGLPSPNHYTTARDMALLGSAIVREFPEYYRWYSLREFTWNDIRQPNRNGLLRRDPTVDGMKTGHTKAAGYCLVTSADRDGMRLISVVMGSSSPRAREDASAALLNYGYTFYETVRLKSGGEAVLEPRIYKSADEVAAIGTAKDLYVTVARGEAASLQTSTRLDAPLIAPLEAGQTVGEITVTGSDGEVVASAPLVTLAAVPEGGMWAQLIDSVLLWFE